MRKRKKNSTTTFYVPEHYGDDERVYVRDCICLSAKTRTSLPKYFHYQSFHRVCSNAKFECVARKKDWWTNPSSSPPSRVFYEIFEIDGFFIEKLASSFFEKTWLRRCQKLLKFNALNYQSSHKRDMHYTNKIILSRVND